MTCPHCGGELVAERAGDGVRVPFGRAGAFVLSARCRYPRCARLVCARAEVDGSVVPVTTEDAVAWSASALASAASQWLWLCGLVVAFAVIPALGLQQALESLRCGGVAWLFFCGGSMLALVPVIYFVRGLAFGAHEALLTAARARATVRAGLAGGLTLKPDPRTYRGQP